MPEDLQALIDHLQRDAVDEGQRRAHAIVAEAQAQADAKLRAAEAEAARIVRDAERDAEVFTERATVALEQAGRDLLITVRQAIDELLSELIHASLNEELRPGVLAEMLVKMADAYTAQGGRERRMAVLLNEEDLDALTHLYVQRYRERMAQGVELRLDDSVRKGYRVQIVDENVTHDFTIDAIAEELSRYLRPRLAEMLPRAAVALTRAEDR